MTKEKRRITTFSKVMSLEEAEREKKKESPTGKSLRKADEEYEKRRRRR